MENLKIDPTATVLNSYPHHKITVWRKTRDTTGYNLSGSIRLARDKAFNLPRNLGQLPRFENERCGKRPIVRVWAGFDFNH
jgi:hypothetical protein